MAAWLVGERFAYLVDQELTTATTKHPKPFTSWYELIGVVQKQLGDMLIELRNQSPDEAMLAEAVQIAAVCARASKDLGLV